MQRYPFEFLRWDGLKKFSVVLNSFIQLPIFCLSIQVKTENEEIMEAHHPKQISFHLHSTLPTLADSDIITTAKQAGGVMISI